MAKNIFDQMHGLERGINQHDELNGLFPLNKSLKKAVSRIRTVTSKIGKKVLPSAVRKIGRQLDKSGITKLAAGAALMVVGGPTILAGLKGAAGIAMKGASLLKTGALAAAKSSALKTVAVGAAKQAVDAYTTAKQNPQVEQEAQQTYEQQRAIIDGINSAMAQSPQFQAAVAQYRAEGYTDEQILQHWMESKAYYLTAVPKVAESIYPQVQRQVASYGVPQEYVDDIAYVESNRIANETVKQVQADAGIGKLLIPGALILLTMMGK